MGWSTDDGQHDPNPSTYGDPPSDVDDAIRAEWRAHVEPLDAVDAVRQAADAAHAAQAALDQAVTQARAVGASWADIGAAAGISRQSAWERWVAKTDMTTIEESV